MNITYLDLNIALVQNDRDPNMSRQRATMCKKKLAHKHHAYEQTLFIIFFLHGAFEAHQALRKHLPFAPVITPISDTLNPQIPISLLLHHDFSRR